FVADRCLLKLGIGFGQPQDELLMVGRALRGRVVEALQAGDLLDEELPGACLHRTFTSVARGVLIQLRDVAGANVLPLVGFTWRWLALGSRTRSTTPFRLQGTRGALVDLLVRFRRN